MFLKICLLCIVRSSWRSYRKKWRREYRKSLMTLPFMWQVNLVEWLKMMVAARRAEDVVDPNLDIRPSTRALKRALLVSLRCLDPEADKRPKMTQVVQMLEADEYHYREVRNHCRLRVEKNSIDLFDIFYCSYEQDR